jgi:hypothetical protein
MKKKAENTFKAASPESRKISPQRSSNISPTRTSGIQSYNRQGSGISPRRQNSKNSIRTAATNSPSRFQRQQTTKVQVVGTEPYRYGQNSSVAQSTSNLATTGFPAELEETFKREPSNNQILSILHVPSNFSKNIQKWKQLGILYATDIERNSNTTCDHSMRCDWNDLKCAFGQVDQSGKMQGVGREVHDHIYEG